MYPQQYKLAKQEAQNMLSTKIVSVEKTTDNVYVNIVMDHREPGYVKGYSGGAPTVNQTTAYLLGEAPEEGRYDVTKNQAILDNCSDYYCSVVRFSIPLDQVPLMICPIVPNQTAIFGAGNENNDLTPLIIGIDYGSGGGSGTKFPMNLIYLPQNPIFTLPQGFVQNQTLQIINPYYFIYSYREFINMINIALETAYINAGLETLFPGYIPPYFYLDMNTNLISLVVPTFFINVTAPATVTPSIFMNAALASYLDAFNTSTMTYDSSQGNDIYFQLNGTYPITPEYYYYPAGIATPAAAALPGPPTLPYYYKFTQEYSVLEYWTSLRSILITTNTIPIRNEYLPGTNNSPNLINVNTNGSNVSYPVLTDFIPQIEGFAGTSRSIAYYLPTAQYRIADMVTETPLYKFDLQIYWVDRDGNLYPINLSLYQQANIKLAFFKKDLFKDTI